MNSQLARCDRSLKVTKYLAEIRQGLMLRLWSGDGRCGSNVPELVPTNALVLTDTVSLGRKVGYADIWQCSRSKTLLNGRRFLQVDGVIL